MAVSELRRALEELIAALDRRQPRVDRVGESSIARDAGALRAKAVIRLAQLGDGSSIEPAANTGIGATSALQVSTGSTPFPARPSDVASLTASEFACGLHLQASVSIDDVCQRFLDDANRALVWLIRFRALTAWCERTETVPWLRAEPVRAQRACTLAASFALNEHWEFDAGKFRSAVHSVAR
jgi:hypothetical protein